MKMIIRNLLVVIFCFFTVQVGYGKTRAVPDTASAGNWMIQAKNFLGQSALDSSLHYFSLAHQIYCQSIQNMDEPELWGHYISSLTYIGKIKLRHMKMDEAADSLFKALDLAMIKLGDQDIRLALIYNELGTLYYRKYDLTKSLEYDGKSLHIKINHYGLYHEEVSNSYNNLGLTYQDLGDYDKALSCFMKTRDIQLHLGCEASAPISGAYYGIGSSYLNKGQYDKAIENLNQALQIRLNLFGETHPLVAETYNELGYYNKLIRDLNEAIVYYKKSRSIYQACFGPEHPSVAYADNNIGVVYEKMGLYNDALEYLNKSLKSKIAMFGEKHPSVANTYANIGSVYLNQEEYDNAHQQYDKALQIRFQTLGENHPSVGMEYANIGQVYSKKSDFEKALECFQKALNIQIQATGKKHPRVAEYYNDIGEVYFNQAQYQKALPFFQKSLTALVPDFADSSGSSNPPIEIALSYQEMLNALQNKAKTFHRLYQQDSERVDDLLVSYQTYQLIPDLMDLMRNSYQEEGSRLLLGEQISGILDDAIQVCTELFRITGKPVYNEEAFRFAEKGKCNTFALTLQESKAKKFAGIPDSLLRSERELKADLVFYQTKIQQAKEKREADNQEKIEDYENTIFSLNRKYQDLVHRFEKGYPKYYALKYQTQTVSIEDLQKVMDEGTALIEYFTGEKVITLFVVTKDSFLVSNIPAGSTFYSTVEELTGSIRKVNSRDFLRASRELYQTLFKPVEPRLKGIQKCVIIPHGILCQTPFEALVSKDPAPSEDIDFTQLDYLVRSFDFTTYLSATLYFNAFQKENEDVPNKTFAGFAPVFSRDQRENQVIVGETDLATRGPAIGGMQFDELKYSEQELKEIIHLFDKKKLKAEGFFREEATEENFKSKCADDSYIHIASHGIVNEAYPGLSCILFSPPEDTASSEDGILYSREIYNLNLNADLLVLSSCESGAGKMIEGEGLMALSRGFLYSGADNLIVSLWKVSDKHTADLMIGLYKNILDGRSYSQSLRLAKLDLIKDPKTAFPRSWGGFVLIGE